MNIDNGIYTFAALGALGLGLCIAAMHGLSRRDGAALGSTDEQIANDAANKKPRQRFYIGIVMIIIVCICALGIRLSIAYRGSTEENYKYTTARIVELTNSVAVYCGKYADTGDEEYARMVIDTCDELQWKWHDLRMMMVYYDIIDDYEYNMMLSMSSYYYPLAQGIMDPEDAESTAECLRRLETETTELLDVMHKYCIPLSGQSQWELGSTKALLEEIDGLLYFTHQGQQAQ